MEWIKDSLHGDIAIDDLSMQLVNSPGMQRLRRLSQIPYANLVYPGANHTRFEHSLGVMHLTRIACQLLGLDDETKNRLTLYGLLHDIGHTALPHVLESIIIENMGMDHEEVGQRIVEKSGIADILRDNGYEPSDISRVPETQEGEVVTGELGSDRIDYLLRDSKYTGVAYGVIDKDRILRKQVFRNGKLVLDISGLSAAEYLLLARFMMFASVYNHKTKAVASLMMKKAVIEALNNGLMKASDLITLDDWSLQFKLLNSGDASISSIVKDVMNRNLYKRVAERRLKEFKNWLFLGGISDERIMKFEKEIAEESGVSDLDIIIFLPRPWFKKFSIPIWYNNDIYSIRETSLISRIINEAQWDYMNVYIFTRKEFIDKVKPVAERFIRSIEDEKFR